MSKLHNSKVQKYTVANTRQKSAANIQRWCNIDAKSTQNTWLRCTAKVRMKWNVLDIEAVVSYE